MTPSSRCAVTKLGLESCTCGLFWSRVLFTIARRMNGERLAVTCWGQHWVVVWSKTCTIPSSGNWWEVLASKQYERARGKRHVWRHLVWRESNKYSEKEEVPYERRQGVVMQGKRLVSAMCCDLDTVLFIIVGEERARRGTRFFFDKVIWKKRWLWIVLSNFVKYMEVGTRIIRFFELRAGKKK